jgi:GT2 family glycosyltransferase
MTGSLDVERLVSPDIRLDVVRRVLDDEFINGHVEVVRVFDSAEPAVQTVIVPVFNQERFIQRCLAGIADNVAAPSDLVMVLDCCSDGSESAVLSFVGEARARFRRVTVLRTTYPIFETRADNLGFLLSRGEFVIEVQSDIEILTGGFDALLKGPMQESPQIFSTSGRGGTWFGQLLPKPERKRRFPIRSRVWECLGWDRIGYTGTSIVGAKDNAGITSVYAQAETVMRGPWCLRRRDLVDLGLLDEKNFFLGNDDHDLNARAQVVGLKCAYVPIAFDSPLEVGSSRRARTGLNLEAYQRLSRRPRDGYLDRFLMTYRPAVPCRYMRGSRTGSLRRMASLSSSRHRSSE